MGFEEDFLALADNAFAKLEWVETEGPDPAASEFAEVATFLKNSDSGQREDLLKKLVTVLAEMFSKEKEKHENQETDEFLVTCPGSTEVFSVGYRGFWLISLLELEEERSPALTRRALAAPYLTLAHPRYPPPSHPNTANTAQRSHLEMTPLM